MEVRTSDSATKPGDHGSLFNNERRADHDNLNLMNQCIDARNRQRTDVGFKLLFKPSQDTATFWCLMLFLNTLWDFGFFSIFLSMAQIIFQQLLMSAELKESPHNGTGVNWLPGLIHFHYFLNTLC